MSDSLSLPHYITPEVAGGKQFENLDQYLNSHLETVKSQLLEAGAVLFRGFDINNADQFEQVAKHIDPGLKNKYLGTSPRNQKSEFTFSASELPDYYPIMQHCEMSFLENAPRKLFFYCHIEPKEGGETPLVDCRKVYQDLDPEVKQAFDEKGVKYIRNYTGPGTKSKFDLWQLKRWDEMFGTSDREQVEEVCKENALELQWKENDGLALINTKSAVKEHPVSHEKVWFNHTQVFHPAAAAFEYGHIKDIRPSFRHFRIHSLIKMLGWFKDVFKNDEEQATNVLFGDGSPIPDSYVKHVVDTFWKHLVITPWKKGDILAIDNYSTSHGRLPYQGDREILVCWSADR